MFSMSFDPASFDSVPVWQNFAMTLSSLIAIRGGLVDWTALKSKQPDPVGYGEMTMVI